LLAPFSPFVDGIGVVVIVVVDDDVLLINVSNEDDLESIDTKTSDISSTSF
jgi:hypothetical protein